MMNLIRNFRLGIKTSIKNILKSLISSFGILFLISFLVMYLSFRDSVKTYIDETIYGKLDINEIKILPKNYSRDNVFVTSTSKGAKITTEQVKAIKANPEFTEVFTLISLDYQCRVKGEMFGKSKRMYIPLYGIEPAFFKGKIKNPNAFKNKVPVPVIAPKFTIEMFNNYLVLNGLPQLTIKDLQGFPIEIDIKTTPPEITDPDEKINYKIAAEVFDFTDSVSLNAGIVPIDFIYKFAAAHSKDLGKWRRGYNYIMLFAKVKDVRKLPQLVEGLEKMGLQVESQEDISRKVGKIMSIMDGFSMVIIAVFLLLTVISIFNSYLTIVYNMNQMFSLRRILGVTKIRIIISFVVEAAIVGSIYGVIGFYTGANLFDYAAKNITQWVPTLKEIAFNTSPMGLSTMLLSIGLSSGISAFAALIPAIFASNINLFKAVRK